MPSQQLPSLVLGRRLAILVALHHGPATLAELYAHLAAAGFGDPDLLPGDSAGDPPPTWKFNFQADLEALRALGYEARYDRKLARYRLAHSPFGLVLDEAQLAALGHLQHTFADHSFPQAPEIQALLRHLVSLLSPAAVKQLSRLPIEITIELAEVSRYETIDPGILKVIRNALKLGRQMEFDYRSPQHDRVLHHCISPQPLILKNGHVYLPGYRDGWTKMLEFRLERLVPESVKPVSRSAHQPIVHREPIRYWLGAAVAQGTVSPRFPQTQVTPQPDGSALVTAETANLWEAHKILLAYGANCQVLAPPALVQLMRDAVAGMAQRYGVDAALKEW